MEAKDLRIGNLIMTRREVVTVDFLNPVSIGWGEGNFGSSDSRLAKFEPILLTESWLIDFGLEKMKESEYTQDSYYFGKYHLWLTSGVILFSDKDIIQYVHQLQNLYFALTGEELNYES